ncbi:MAG: hypothetical protein EPN69_00785 [Rhodanobacter sp.]|nr:MAG: hypothetical protein EPN69_00785 [Rhodanobacter sp.]TAM06726.1 MAG: hypothetical protein EPN71_00745 [Rhodanobacter sp.]TAM38691.1 MAG: hypothetical protein EPN58_16545 [Rhodanobacter sp.]TAN23716.1 MAG: hypothetical protein EPN32_11120 [Rhodanobacter sp.]
MNPQTQLDELKKLHKDYIANTFLFTSKVLDQRRHISDAQAEVIHGLLHDLAASAGNPESGQDPAAIAQDAMRKISESFASQSAQSSDFFKETAAAYAEILRLAMGYSADTFVGMQTATHDAGRINASTTAVSNPWMDSFISAFENASEMMSSGLKPMMKAAGSTARAMGASGKSGGAGKAPR